MDHEEHVPVRPYDPDVFDRLSLFRTAKILLVHNYDRIKLLGDVIVSHQRHHLFGISLLHKHFDLHHDEIIVRHIDAPRRVAHIWPASRHTDAVPYLWKALRDARGRLQFAPLEFVRRVDARESEAVDLTQSEPFLTAIANALAERDLLDVFGIATTSLMRIPLAHHELLVETTDSENRKLTITPMHRSEVQVAELTETFWTFTPGPVVDIGGVIKCTGTHCTGHCKSHCKQHCYNHCIGGAGHGDVPDVHQGEQALPGLSTSP
jgi:hypothetical protein